MLAKVLPPILLAAALATAPASAFDLKLMGGSLCHPGFGDPQSPHVHITGDAVLVDGTSGCRVKDGWRQIDDTGHAYEADLVECLVGQPVPDMIGVLWMNEDTTWTLQAGLFSFTGWPCAH